MTAAVATGTRGVPGQISARIIKLSAPYKPLYTYRVHAVGHVDNPPQIPGTPAAGTLYKRANSDMSWPNCVLCVLGVFVYFAYFVSLCPLRPWCLCVLRVPGDDASVEAV